MKTRKVKTLIKRWWQRAFRVLQRFGVNVVPEHFYSAIPNIADLERRTDWRRPRSMYGIVANDPARQIALLDAMLSPQFDVLRSRSVLDDAIVGGGADGGYGEIEADVLFAFVATNRPKRIVQVGCGVSTAIMLQAAKHANYRPEIVCVDPFPSGYLIDADKNNLIRLVDKPAQLVELSILTDLEAGDLLFIDSTHAVKPGSEVNYLVHEVMPRLAPGVWVHFHDIYFPYDYGRHTPSDDLFFAQETALLYAFLTGNRGYRVEISLSLVHYACPDELRRLIPKYKPDRQIDGLSTGAGGHFPSSIWLRTVKQPQD
ncbi:MAG: class I SAM-dependent methyltransferase [Reyranella sp.]|uniref:class I SAM-dependent methyltransferase n=1 Tax=Reyranella sp. TaxID=1929291 RepID=UPI00273113F7|nr:class I SAM-dependent methyltransferase [Reyranella sp.]MDP1967456.1 class I SAM-dependent methyltransferase [Reyranella sp.]MDP2376434.1 class I SAM-dependent methyltransferase [Reyranella sp.]